MPFARLVTALKALRQLGLTQVALNAVYKLGLKSGHYRRVTASPKKFGSLVDFRILNIHKLPPPEALRKCLGAEGMRALLAEADEITAGKFRQFGGQAVEIDLAPPGPLAHWTAYETGQASHGAEDIKLIWEPARFGWAFSLGRAFRISGDEKYAKTFWGYFEIFQRANPAYLGPNWSSGQEVGLRLMAFVWAGQVFAGSEHSTPECISLLVESIAVHAARIPPTLLYARSQNNNHLLTEAAALLTAGLTLPRHPDSKSWQQAGRRWLDWCFREQIDSNGEYVQHSANYQRLALQTALWVNALPDGHLNASHQTQLARASQWLAARLDPISGQVPNLGANDGALIFPLACAEFSDYRPAAAACARAFLGQQLPTGVWDEMSLWFGLPLTALPAFEHPRPQGFTQPTGHMSGQAWGSLRAVHYTSRPSHADQLHCELWWRGINIARDPGTYRYNAPPPWDNQLTSTLLHNSVTVNGQEQMTRAGRFLYLDWANADYLTGSGDSVIASTTAYARLGVRHTRSLAAPEAGGWLIKDELRRSSGGGLNTYRLHWLLPDWEWELDNQESLSILRVLSPHGWVSLAISATEPFKRVGLHCAGELISGDSLLSPVFGWFSPTYNVKEPALALAIEVQSAGSVNFQSMFTFPK